MNVSRRRFLTYSAAASAGTLAALGLAPGGASAVPARNRAARRSARLETSPEAVGGSLKIGMGSVVDGLTPFAIQGYVWSQMLGFVLRPADQEVADGTILPCLATEWDTSIPPRRSSRSVRASRSTTRPLTAADVAY